MTTENTLEAPGVSEGPDDSPITEGRVIQPYPAVELDASYVERPGRITLLNYYLAFPHFVVLVVLNMIGAFGLMAAWFAVTFTGRYPRGIFNYVTAVEGWGLRVSAYIWGISREYPPFELRPTDYPVSCQFAYPEQGIARWRPLIQGILIWPRLVFVGMAIGLRAMFRWYVAWFSVLFTGRYPRASYEMAVRSTRWGQRNWAYRNFLVDQYPPTFAQT